MPTFRGANGLYIARKLGLSDGLDIALDVGDAACYPGSGQSVYDLSANGNDFYRGLTGSVQANDPTFNGTAGRLSSGEYFSTDGGDYLKLAGSNPTAIANAHKAGARFTVAIAAKPVATVSFYQGWLGTRHTNSSLADGIEIFQDASDDIGFLAAKGNSAVCLAMSSASLTPGSVSVIAVSVDEAAAAGYLVHNDAVDAFDASYASPTTDPAGSTLELMAAGNGFLPAYSGAAVSMLWAWSVALKPDQMAALVNAIRGRYGV